MPKVAMDYSRTVIYHFVCQDTNIHCSYVGSTTNFTKRKRQHKCGCQKESGEGYNYLLYQTIRDNGGWTNWSMVPLEEYPCENKTQQRIREQYWINSLKPELNMKSAHATKGEYYQKHAEEIKERSRVRRETHAEELKEYQKEYQKTHKEQRREYDKEYRETQKEKVTKYKHEWYLKNKSKATNDP